MIRVYNGPECISAKLHLRRKVHQIELAGIQAGGPAEKAYIRRFIGACCGELSQALVCRSLKEFNELAGEYLQHYDKHRPHKVVNSLLTADYEKLERR